MKTIFFQSSMPRSGSTLLQNIMGQNPKFYVTPTSGLSDLVLGSRIGYNYNEESKAVDQDEWKDGFYSYCRWGMQGYFDRLTDKPYVLDKSRSWKGYYGLLKMILPKAKMIVMIRDLRDIVASMEQKYRTNPDRGIEMVDNIKLTGITPLQRAEIWLKTHPIAISLLRIENLLMDYQNVKDVLFVRYEDLCLNPHKTISDIYKYLEIEEFNHNFNYIEQITHENDTVHGIYGDHKINNVLEKSDLNSYKLLGENTCNLIKENFLWYFNTFGYI